MNDHAQRQAKALIDTWWQSTEECHAQGIVGHTDQEWDRLEQAIAHTLAEARREGLEVYPIAGEQAIAQVDDLRAQLTAMTAERDEQRIINEELIHSGYLSATRKLQQQLTNSEDRCTRLEEALKAVMQTHWAQDAIAIAQHALTSQAPQKGEAS